MWLSFARVVRELRRTYRGALDAYRPERHYMRGPGPKCRAKQMAGATSAPAAAEPRPALQEIAKVHA